MANLVQRGGVGSKLMKSITDKKRHKTASEATLWPSVKDRKQPKINYIHLITFNKRRIGLRPPILYRPHEVPVEPASQGRNQLENSVEHQYLIDLVKEQ